VADLNEFALHQDLCGVHGRAELFQVVLQSSMAGGGTERPLKPRLIFVLLVLGMGTLGYMVDQLGKTNVPMYSSLVSFVNVPSVELMQHLGRPGSYAVAGGKRCAKRAAQENLKTLMRHHNNFDQRGQGALLHRFLIAHADTSHNSVIVDVGANTGAFSLAAVKIADTIPNIECYVFAYEPVHSTYEELVQAVSTSHGNIRPLNLGVGRQSGRMRIRYTGTGDQSATFLGSMYQRRNGTETKLVDVVALDDEVRSGATLGLLGGLVTVVKISTEGFNYRSLQGMRGILQEHTVKMIMWDYDMREATERKLVTEINFVSSFGYMVFLLGSTKGRDYKYFAEGQPNDDHLRLLRVDGDFHHRDMDAVRKKYNMVLTLVALAPNHTFVQTHHFNHAVSCGLDGCGCKH